MNNMALMTAGSFCTIETDFLRAGNFYFPSLTLMQLGALSIES